MPDFKHLLQPERLLPRHTVILAGQAWTVLVSLDLLDGWYFHILMPQA